MRLPLAFCSLFLTLAHPLSAQSQRADGEVFLATELTTPPRLQDRGIRYYPQHPLPRKVRVSVQFVVDTTGRPEPSTFTVSGAPDSSVAEAVRSTILTRHYLPGAFRGTKIRVLMKERLTLKPEASCAEPVAVQGVPMCVDSLRRGD